MRLFLSDTCYEPLFALPKKIQTKVVNFQKKFRECTTANGMHLEPIAQFNDSSMRTARIDDNYRAVIGLIDDNAYLLYVGTHENAYNWGIRKKLVWNDHTQACQLVTIQQTTEIIVKTEEKESGITKRHKILTAQANHNADFAAFFGVAMALGSEKSFDEIFDEYMEWAAKIEDKHEGSLDTYTKRGRVELLAYDGTNWADAHFYMYHNEGNWTIDNADQGKFNTKWEYVKKEGNVLLKKGETYSMLFPYCTGCWDEGGEATREYWDYWSGKLIIFESTQASKDHPHVLRGSNYVAATRPAKGDWVFANDEVLDEYPEVVVTGNSSLAHMTTNRTDVFIYTPSPNKETFYPFSEDDEEQVIYPSTAFLYGYVPTNAQGMPAKGIKRTGEIIYDKENTPTDLNQGGNIPTVGGGNDLFITARVAGVNIAVAEPQQVRVMSATGAIIFSGMVQTAVDVALPTTGVYVITGENEVHKILH